MFDTIFGLPTHALIVHAVVVLLPLAAAGAVAVALIPALRRRFGVLVAALTVASVASVPVATRAGQRLYDRKSAAFGPGDDAEAGLMQRHRDLAQGLLPWALVLLVATLLVVSLPLVAARSRSGAVAAGSARMAGPIGPPGWTRWVTLLAIAGVLVGAVVSTVMVIRIGHAGSAAVWEPLLHPSPQR
jgi:hypothetical protein